MKENGIFSVAVAISAGLVLLLSFGRFINDSSMERFQISVVVSDSSSARWVPFRAGLDQAARDNNIELNFVSSDRLISVQQERRIIAREIENGADGIIAALRSSEGTAEMLSEFSGKAAIALVDTDVEAAAEISGEIVRSMPDNAEIGKALAAEVLLGEAASSESRSIGILAGNQRQFSMQQRLLELQQALLSEGWSVSWVLEDGEDPEGRIRRANNEKRADVIVALEEEGLKAAVSYLRNTGRQYIPLYGVGCSDELVYYLDSGLIRSMIVPEEFNMGYQALTDLAERLDHRENRLLNREIGFRVVNRENMYSEDNQRILFPLIQ